MTSVFLRSLCLLTLLGASVSPAAAVVNEASQQASRELVVKGVASSDDFFRARRLLEEALVANPANAHALSALGQLYERQKKTDLARKYFRLALDVEPTEPDALFGAAKLDIADGRTDEAADKLRMLELSCPGCRQTNELTVELNGRTPEPGRSLNAIPSATHP